MRSSSTPDSRRHKMPFGAEITPSGTLFQLWAPKCRAVQLKLRGRKPIALDRDSGGWHRVEVPGVGAGARYRYQLPRRVLIADPASRFQPSAVDGDSEVIDPAGYRWRNTTWIGRPWEEAVLYEIHPGAFTAGGTWRDAIDRLDHLQLLGVTAIELMPVAQGYGGFNWGYDGALWFAPSAAYGRPEDLKALVDAAHHRGLMVILDVVYNHFGAIGNAMPQVAPAFTKRHDSPWGEAINLDDAGSEGMRALIVENALYWLAEFNLDGLRLDAVHVLKDDSNTHILELLAARVRAAHPFRHIHLIAENSDNEERWLRRDAAKKPVHYTAQWNDDLHHVLHAAATGEVTGYYADFENDTPEFEKLGRALAEGFTYQGEVKRHEGQRRGQASAGLPPTAFVTYMQNHDQIGNRVHGDRIHNIALPDAVEAFAAVCLLSPQIPMLFMGEEFAASSPFPFFSDMPPDIRAKVWQGRKDELKKTPEHDDPTKPKVEATPDPTDRKTFASARLNWEEVTYEVGKRTLTRYKALLDLRRHEIVPRLAGMGGFSGSYERLGENAVQVEWQMGDGSQLRLYLNLSDTSQSKVSPLQGRPIWQSGYMDGDRMGPWTVVWTIDV